MGARSDWQLAEALRLGPSPCLALVGAGGKTTALFRLGRELIAPRLAETQARRALLTASTHLATEQIGLADHHITVHCAADVEALDASLPAGLILLTGPLAEAQRTAGLDLETLASLYHLAQARRLPLLVEADGSRRRPLKAPASHEPVIPEWVESVVVVAGLSALGKPLDAAWVHRPERFAEISGLPAGAPLTPQALARALRHPAGGLKGVPPNARRVALLNQADTALVQAAGGGLAAGLLDAYHAVLVAALSLPEALAPPEARSPSDASTASQAETRIWAVHERVAGVLLAAGASSRFGKPKQVLPWRGEPLVRHMARSALAAGLSPLVVVTGHAAEPVQQALQGLPLTLAHNPHWQAGQSTSVIAGLDALPPETGAALFLLADQPQVPVSLIRSLVERHAGSLAPVVAPLVDGQRGNPVLFDRCTFADLARLRGDVGGRAIFSRYHIEWLPWHDSSLCLNVDTEEDYQRLLDM